ncbi:MAG: alpha-L-fucosidase [Planctomycetota bacterium]|nr:alpha-L-fucosidase [Planctomycetota bacterium]
MRIRKFLVPFFSLALATSVITSNARCNADEIAPPDFAWWREARFGMFVHWGLYSEAGSVWKDRFLPGWSEWMLNRKKIPPAEYYAELMPRFDPADFDANAWVIAAKNAGMKYIVITTKHHEGFAIWPSAIGDRDIAETKFGKPIADGGRGRDPLRELADACERHGLKLGFYYSLLDWAHPDYLPRREWDMRPIDGAEYSRYAQFMRAQVKELLDGRYGKIAVLWGDGDWEHGAREHTSDEIVAMARALQPGILVNDRWSQPGDYATPENKIPESRLDRPWETCMTLNGSWGFARDDYDFKSAPVVLQNLADIVSKGGNYLLNIGPDGRGRIDTGSLAVLAGIGQWMQTHSTSIYRNGHTALPIPEWGRWTMGLNLDGTSTLNAHIFSSPKSGVIRLDGVIDDPTEVRVLGGEFASPTFRREGPDVVANLEPAALDAISKTSAHSVLAFDFATAPRILTAPAILGDERMFVGTTTVRFAPPPAGATIHLTTDGSQPNANTVALGANDRGEFAVVLDRTSTLRARTSWQGNMSNAETTVLFSRSELLPAKKCGDTLGLEARVILGEFEIVPANEAFEVSTQKSLNKTITIPVGVPADRYAVQLQGMIDVPASGVYRFEIASDDGSELWIAGVRIIDNGGLHGAIPKVGDVALAIGCHDLDVRMFESVGSEALVLRWRLPLTTQFAEIPVEAFRRKP